MGTPYPVFPFTEAEFAYWPRPAVGVASDADEARALVRAHRSDQRETFGVQQLRREFCRIWAGVSAEAVARGNQLPDGTWRLHAGPDGRGIEVTGWFVVDADDRQEPGMRQSKEDSWTTC